MANYGIYQRFVEKQNNSAVAAGALIPELDNLIVPGADGVRRFLCDISITAGKSLNFYQIHIGPIGGILDPLIHYVPGENRNLVQWQTAVSGTFELLSPVTGLPITSTDRVTVSVFAWAGGANNVIAGATGGIIAISTFHAYEYLYRRGVLA